MTYLVVGWSACMLSSCVTVWQSVRVERTNYLIHADSLPVDTPMWQMIQPYRQALVQEMSEVLIEADTPLVKAKPESTLGNFFADALYEAVRDSLGEEIDFAIQNYGGLRLAMLPRGAITLGHLYELMPFENYIVIMEGDSALIQRLFDRIAQNGGWPVSRQVRFRIVGERAEDIRIHGQPLQSGVVYRFALPDYIANGGDRMFFLREVPRKSTSLLVRDAVIAVLRKWHRQGRHLHPKLEGRIGMDKESK